ncbi:hypothetical protein BGZ52_000910 [Haplosporangium bisporale]|nr:hypothetical protein BGZ52_000910 [Haplosporangium bisporale]
MHCLVLSGLTAIIASCIAASPLSASVSSPQFRLYEEFHRLITIPKNWEKQRPPPLDTLLHLKIDLTLQNVNAFHQKVLDISTPGHPSYGMHMSQAEIDNMLKPADESAKLVLKWLRSHNIQGVLDSQSVKANVTVTQANKLLQTQYSTYRNTESGNEVFRTMVYHLPTTLTNHVDVISPTTMFPSDLRVKHAVDNRKHHAIDLSCRYTITMRCLEDLYRLPRPFPPVTPDKPKQQPDYLGTNFTFIPVNGGMNSQNLSEAGTEADLDIQIARGLAPEYETQYYLTVDSPETAPFVNSTDSTIYYEILLEFLLAQEKLPHTFSISYGDPEQNYPLKHAERLCNLFAQLGARGTSVIVSSGDLGVGDGNPHIATQTCFSNDGKNKTVFLPAFPSSCPFVTSVGATASFNPEIAVSRFYSGGGFSWYFPRPSYQATAVDAYLAQLPKGLYDGLYNPEGRAYPDVAAQGAHFQIWNRGEPILAYGTSASAPTFAAVITHLNGHRLRQGKEPLGFLNPWLYGKGKEALNDIVSGYNPGCGTEGFAATPGWDPPPRIYPGQKLVGSQLTPTLLRSASPRSVNTSRSRLISLGPKTPYEEYIFGGERGNKNHQELEFCAVYTIPTDCITEGSDSCLYIQSSTKGYLMAPVKEVFLKTTRTTIHQSFELILTEKINKKVKYPTHSDY